MKTIEVKLDDRVVIVKKLPIGAYADLLTTLEELPKHFEEITNLSNDQILIKLPKIISASLNDFAKIVSTATNLTQQNVLDSLDLYDVTVLIVEIVKINRYSEAWANIKKVMAQPNEVQEIPAQTPGAKA